MATFPGYDGLTISFEEITNGQVSKVDTIERSLFKFNLSLHRPFNCLSLADKCSRDACRANTLDLDLELTFSFTDIRHYAPFLWQCCGKFRFINPNPMIPNIYLGWYG